MIKSWRPKSANEPLKMTDHVSDGKKYPTVGEDGTRLGIVGSVIEIDTYLSSFSNDGHFYNFFRWVCVQCLGEPSTRSNIVCKTLFVSFYK